MSVRFALLGAAMVLTSTTAQAGTIDGTVETEFDKGSETRPSETRVYVKTRRGRHRVVDPAMETTLYRFRNRSVSLEGTITKQVLTVSKIRYPIRWDGVVGTIGRTRPGKKRFSPLFTRKGGKTLRVFGRSYFLLKRITGKQATIRGWYFSRSNEVCVTAVRGEMLTNASLLRGLKITGQVRRGDAVWVHDVSLFRVRLLLENAKGQVGHVMPEEVRVGEPTTPARTGRGGLKQAIEADRG